MPSTQEIKELLYYNPNVRLRDIVRIFNIAGITCRRSDIYKQLKRLIQYGYVERVETTDEKGKKIILYRLTNRSIEYREKHGSFYNTTFAQNVTKSFLRIPRPGVGLDFIRFD